MRKWKYFRMAEAVRPETSRIFRPEERPELEKVIARQVANLLTLHAQVWGIKLPSGDGEAVVTYEMLEFYEQELEDGTAFSLGQLPPEKTHGMDFLPGVYTLHHYNEHEKTIRRLLIHDASHKVESFVQDDHGRPVDIDVLQELYEVCGVLADSNRIHLPPFSVHDPTRYPRLTTGLEPGLLSSFDPSEIPNLGTVSSTPELN